MCGISGFLHNNVMDLKVLKRMNSTIGYRGPDSSGYYLKTTKNGRQLGLAHNRLSILDLSVQGNQPMFSPSKNIVIIYNGEIYNFFSIKEELQALGYRFTSKTDTEVILYAYQEWGIDCIQRFNGMFAIALYDFTIDTLYLIRDRMGVKPLYYYFDGENIAFASELKPIMEYPLFSKELDFESINMYLHHQYITAPNTIFNNTYKLSPGNYLAVSNESIQQTCYWQVKNHLPSIDELSEYEYVSALDSLLLDSVKLRMLSDVPIGSFLSGGIDSSLITAVMQKHSSKPVKTFTIGFKDSPSDESMYARQISKYLGTEHHEEFFTNDNLTQLIEQIPVYYDEPFADNSQLPTMMVSQIAKKTVTVVLTGDGGDELFCGYNRYFVARQRHKHLKYYRALSKLIQFIPMHRLVLNSQLNPDKSRIFHLTSDESIINADYLCSGDYLRDFTPLQYNFNNKYFSIPSAANNILDKFMLRDMVTYLPDDILTKVDRASMRSSIETRTPLLDYRIVEFALGLPINYKYRNGVRKHALKQVLSKYIPNHLVDRPKTGFAMPTSKWLREELKVHTDRLLNPQYIIKQGIFNPDITSNILHVFKNKPNKYVDKLVWTLLIFQLWHERYMD